ncbi:TonB-dependent receptor domain-containing protein [Herminiimonas arsenitoxidans]|uniref:TonB-dependent receptor domain-containing protein n=1 Tax=Herminiimonas arsenitoxidans TaxID=1809410 RepID=UPI0009704939|nr:TonB-dependent receptor [Herminiimonas arsenitoxidans]
MAVQHPQDFARPFAVTSSRIESGLERHARRVWPIAAALLVASATASAQQATADQHLQEVVVSASGFEQAIKDAPASITVITREQLETNRVNSIAEALRGVEGVDVGDAPGKTGGLNISMRGMNSRYTLILIDGRRQNTAGTVTPNGFGETSTSFLPPPAAIERIEVIRGPMSTLYGSDAMGGVINIITRKVGKVWSGTVTAETTLQGKSEFGDSQAGSVYLSGPLVENLLGLQVRARKYHRDDSNIQWPGKTPGSLTLGNDPVKSDVENVGAKLSFTPNKDNDISLDIDSTRQKYDNSRGQLGTLDRPGAFRGYGPEQKFNRDQITLAHTLRMANSVLESSISHTKTETIGRTIPNAAPGGKVAGSPRTLESESTIFDTKLVTSLDTHMLSVGAQWWEAKMVDAIAPRGFDQKQIGVFAEDEWRIRKDLALTVGVRHDHHSTFGGSTTPRVYLVWNSTDQWTFKGGISKAYRTPSLEQLVDGLSGIGSQGTTPLYGNPSLSPERSTSSELGTYFDNNNGFRANATIFHTDFKNAISTINGYVPPGGGAPGNRPVNVDNAVIKGIELGSSIEFARVWRLAANYTYTDSEQKSGANIGRPLENTPKHAANMKLDWRTSEQLNLWAQAEYKSARYRSEDSGAFTNTKALLGDYKSYYLLNIGGTYKVNKAFAINMAVNNLLDKNFVDYRPVTTTGSNPTRPVASYANQYISTMEPRRLWISANYTF